jgi:hypothetical protein
MFAGISCREYIAELPKASFFKPSFFALQAESVRDAAFGCDWVGTPVPFQRHLIFIIAIANKEFQLTAGKFVPVSNVTMMNVCIHVKMLAVLRK